VTFQAKNNVGSASDSTALAQVLHHSHNVGAANFYPHSSGERSGAQKKQRLA